MHTSVSQGVFLESGSLVAVTPECAKQMIRSAEKNIQAICLFMDTVALFIHLFIYFFADCIAVRDFPRKKGKILSAERINDNRIQCGTS